MTKLRMLGMFASGMLVVVSGFSESTYERWVDQEVKWIIGKDEQKRFEALTSDEQRDRFIEQFWLDRDPTQGTPRNEYKEEHYLRLKFANEQFREGSIPGWRTDRGRVYIIHGPPVSRRLDQDLEYWDYPGNPLAEYYKGPLTLIFERGGSTFQQRAISESRQGQAQLEIYTRGARNTDVMTSVSSRFRLVRAGPGLGAGGAILTSSGETDRYIADMLRSPGELLDEQKRDAERRQESWKALRGDVSAGVTFGDLDCEVSASQFYRGRESLVFFEVQIDSRQLEFEKRREEAEEARLDVFCEMLDATDQYQVDLLDETVVLSRLSKAAEVSKRIPVFSNRFRVLSGDYELRCLIQDVVSRKVGEGRTQLSVPKPVAGKVALSSLVLTQSVQESDAVGPAGDAQLLFRNLSFPGTSVSRVIPSQPVYLFFEVYEEPDSRSTDRFLFDYRLYNQEQIFLNVAPQKLEWKQTGHRFSQALQFDLTQLPVGEYSFLVKVVDRESRAHSMKLISFEIEESMTGKP